MNYSLEDLQALNEVDDIFELMGQELSAEEAPAFPISRSEAIKRAKKWYYERIGKIGKAICEDSNIRSLVENNDTKNLIIAVSDLIASICIGVSPIAVSYLLVKLGLKSLCGSIWDKKDLK